jgi:multimeric flavodoxin WrbA
MKIICLLGSPRKRANSSMIAERFCTTAQKLGAEVQTFTLNDLHFRGCQGCMACKTRLDRCVLEDDLTEVLEAVRETDVLVLASPVYFWDVSSQLKAFLDRTFSYLVPDFITRPLPEKSRLAPGKQLVFILAQGNPDESLFTNIFPKFDYFFQMNGFAESRFIRACGVRELGEVEEARPDVMRLAEETAARMCGR